MFRIAWLSCFSRKHDGKVKSYLKSADAEQQNFQKESHIWRKKRINLKTNNSGVETYYSASLEVDWTLVRDFCQSLSSSEGRAQRRKIPAGRTHHAGCAPDVSRGVVPWAYQHLQGAVLPRLDVLSEMLVLKTRNLLLNSSRLLRRGESTSWEARVDQSSLPLHFSCTLHPHQLFPCIPVSDV